MSNTRTERRYGLRRWLGRFIWTAAAFAIFYFLFFDPWQMHGGDGWLQHRIGYQVDGGEAHIEESGELWTCPMHPHILEEEPGTCPICKMDLVPLEVESPSESGKMSGEREVLLYRNPMNPAVTSPVPMQDEMGMEYVPVYTDEVEGEAGEGTGIRIDPSIVQNMNVRTAVVDRRDIHHRIRTVGTLEYDQERMVSVTTKFSGWVEKVYANYVGEPIRKGQPLFEIYSPELVQTEQELLSALKYTDRLSAASEDARMRAEFLVDAARTRLGYWDISPEQIAQMEASGEVMRTLQVVAPASGLVMKRMEGLEGMAVRPGMEIFHIADLSVLWLAVEIFEDQVAWINRGTAAEVTFAYFPGETFHGKVRYIEPEFSEQTRTLRVKLAIPNPGGRLRTGMFATVIFRPVAGEPQIAVPSLAVLRTGERNVVVIQHDGGRFEPREVVLGREGEGYVAVLEGLSEGERVVTSAQFLLDSEASLQEAIQKMIARRSEREGR